MILFFTSCQRDEIKPGKLPGSLHIDIGLSVRVSEVDSRLKSTQQTEDFKVVIYTLDGTELQVFDPASSMPDSIELEPGQYYVEAHSDNNLPAAFENPYYCGVSDVFTISSNTQQSVQVECSLANTVVSVVYSDNIINEFTDYTTTVASALDSLVFGMNETRMGYFRTLPLEIHVTLAYQNPDGTDSYKNLYGSIPSPLANRHYEILVDASVDAGIAAFQITLDESAAPLEVVEIGDGQAAQPTGEIAYGEILITEIMYDPSALSDTEGEWFEIYNNSGRELNLQNLILGRDDANRHTITDSLVLSPGAYFVLARSGTATSASNTYIYGADISLTNSGAVLAVFNEGTETDPGALIFAVDYGEAGFPGGTGASICLAPDRLSAADAVAGSAWCTSSSAYSTGDLGTPGALNDPCQ